MKNENLSNFVTSNPNKTPPMTVQVIDHRGKVINTYDGPAGFQLDRYVNSLYPDAEIMVSATHMELNVSVILHGTDDIYEIHRGVYRSGIYSGTTH